MSKVKKVLEKVPLYDSLVLPYHWSKAFVAATTHGFPGRKLRVIGVTGTNGKTTTCFMIWKMLNEAGHKTGLMTTVAWGGVSGREKDLHEQVEHMTTVSPKVLNQRIKEIKKAGAEFLVLEVTSHALAQYRTLGVPIEIAVMTNVTHEHLDYHKTFERYRDAKRKLFKKGGFGVINADDPSAEFFKKDIKKYATYGIENGENLAKGVKMGISKTKYSCGDINVELKMPGIFNIYNSLATICVGKRLGLTDEQIENGLAALAGVEGRTTSFNEGQNFDVMIDYAHTPDAFEKLLPDIKKATKGRLIVMFGSAGGRRDPSKREPQGEIAGKYADIVVLTEEDDRDTPGMEILEQIAVGARKSGKEDGKNLFFELNRPKAILMSLERQRKVIQ